MTGDREHALARRNILWAYIAVMDKPEKLLAACATASGDANEVRRAVEKAFNLTALAADAVLSMQIRRFTPRERERIEDELEELEAALA